MAGTCALPSEGRRKPTLQSSRWFDPEGAGRLRQAVSIASTLSLSGRIVSTSKSQWQKVCVLRWYTPLPICGLHAGALGAQCRLPARERQPGKHRRERAAPFRWLVQVRRSTICSTSKSIPTSANARIELWKPSKNNSRRCRLASYQADESRIGKLVRAVVVESEAQAGLAVPSRGWFCPRLRCCSAG